VQADEISAPALVSTILVEAPPGTPGAQPVIATTPTGCAATSTCFYQ
jgi:hypothetical protein